MQNGPSLPPPQAAPQGTRLALIEAGFRLFARNGFEGASTRAIAAEAGANIASIAYHFGGKEGLRAACAEEFARRLAGAAGPFDGPVPATPAEARLALHGVIDRMARFAAAGDEAGAPVGFILRELAEGGATLERVYAALLEPLHRRFCLCWGLATGREAESAAVRLAVFSLIGQVAYFRIGRPLVMRRMGWAAIGPDELAAIAGRLHANLDAMLDAMLAAEARP